MAINSLSWSSVLRLIRLHHLAVGNISVLCLIVLSIMDYGILDLFCWFETVEKENIPLTVLMYIGGLKVAIILFLALWCWTREAEKNQEDNLDMPISYVRKRYCRFLVMHLLASIDRLIHHHLHIDDFLQGHKDCVEAVEQFRWRARRLFERTDLQLCVPLHEVLSVDDQQEKELLRLGYGDKLEQLRELDIYKMIYKD
ncbi:uncharacterized protein LOC117140341 [Drosophila mauritiana]|uniref:Uncharacterized protein LOC117140341 n=1 Tax=Drosophila mauritiana TaxID=7226 RepID=A0A6P8K7Q0_DROMA|nr:uncharacterized protein LOC117140341 [Drosophila mauritiana]